MFDLQKVGQCHGVQLYQWRQSIENIKIYVNFDIFCHQDATCANENMKHTHIHTHRETFMSTALGQITDFYKNQICIFIIVGI